MRAAQSARLRVVDEHIDAGDGVEAPGDGLQVAGRKARPHRGCWRAARYRSIVPPRRLVRLRPAPATPELLSNKPATALTTQSGSGVASRCGAPAVCNIAMQANPSSAAAVARQALHVGRAGAAPGGLPARALARRRAPPRAAHHGLRDVKAGHVRAAQRERQRQRARAAAGVADAHAAQVARQPGEHPVDRLGVALPDIPLHLRVPGLTTLTPRGSTSA